MKYYPNKISFQKMSWMKIVGLLFLVCGLWSMAGCQTTTGNTKETQNYSLSSVEAEWIRHGQPIKFEEELWYPADGVEGFLDTEMRLMGEYKGVQFFTDKVDVRPFARLYTKFGKNKFRFFEKRIGE